MEASDYGLTVQEACEAIDNFMAEVRNDPELRAMWEAQTSMVDAELHHRGLAGPAPQRWLRRLRWIMWGRADRQRSHPV